MKFHTSHLKGMKISLVMNLWKGIKEELSFFFSKQKLHVEQNPVTDADVEILLHVNLIPPVYFTLSRHYKALLGWEENFSTECTFSKM